MSLVPSAPPELAKDAFPCANAPAQNMYMTNGPTTADMRLIDLPSELPSIILPQNKAAIALSLHWLIENGYPFLTPLAGPFFDGDVPVQWKLREVLDGAARLRPMYFKAVDRRSLSNAQNDARIVG